MTTTSRDWLGREYSPAVPGEEPTSQRIKCGDKWDCTSTMYQNYERRHNMRLIRYGILVIVGITFVGTLAFSLSNASERQLSAQDMRGLVGRTCVPCTGMEECGPTCDGNGKVCGGCQNPGVSIIGGTRQYCCVGADGPGECQDGGHVTCEYSILCEAVVQSNQECHFYLGTYRCEAASGKTCYDYINGSIMSTSELDTYVCNGA